MTTFVSDWAACKIESCKCIGFDALTACNLYITALPPNVVRQKLKEAGAPPVWIEAIK